MNTLMQIICGWCKKPMGWKFGSGVTHSICKKCKAEMEAEI